VNGSSAAELELGPVLRLVAAHARTEAGRRKLLGIAALPAPGEGVLASRLTAEVARLAAEEGSLALGGVDEALPLVAAGAPPPREIADLLALAGLARRVAGLRRQLLALPAGYELLGELGRRLPDTEGLVAWVSQRLARDGTVPDTATPQLARARRDLARVRSELLRILEGVRRAHRDAVTDAPPTVRRDRYCLPVRAAARARVPGLVLDASGSGATVFVEPFEAVEANNRLAELAAREREEVRRVLDEVAAALAAAVPELRGAVEVVATLDAAQAKVRFGEAVAGTLVVPEGDALVLRRARHPLLDPRLAPLRREVLGEPEGRTREVVPLDLELPSGVRALLVTGPNAGGKTVVLKTVGLMVLLAHHGVPIPAEEGTRIPAVSCLWAHIGDEQDVARDLSTFSAAMARTAELLATAGPGTLALYDELGAGTDPLEGAALGVAVLEALVARGATVVATSHLAAIAQHVAGAPGMVNAAMEYDEARDRPTYRLRVGRPGRSRGLEIARRMGLPARVLERAAALLGERHLELERWLDRLERLERQMEAEREAALRARSEAEARARELERERERLEAERRELPRRLEAEREALRRRAAEQLDRALARLDEAVARAERLGRRRRERLRREALDLGGTPAAPTSPAAPVEPGARVRVRSFGAEGTVEEVRGAMVRVAVGGKRLWVARDDLETAAGREPTRSAVRVEVRAPEERELKLLGRDAEAARDELERFLDRAMAAGTPRVRIVHGHGTGTLRRVVREVCRTHPAVRAFRHPPQHLGGTGVTEIELGDGDG